MKDSEEGKKKKTPKKKDKKKRLNSSLTNGRSIEDNASPYSDKIPGLRPVESYMSTSRTRSRHLEPLQNTPKNSGVLVDTLFPSEHLVAMSIAASEQMDSNHITKEQMASIDADINMSPFPESGPTDYEMEKKNQISVLDPDNRKCVATKCISSREDALFVGPSGDDPKPSDPYVLSRCMIQKRFGSGVLLLRPMEMKPTQLVTRGDLIFQLWYGRVSLTIHETTTVIVSGDFFFVPRGNTYSIRNLRNEEAKFSYTVVKEIDAIKEAEEKIKKEQKEKEEQLGMISRQGTTLQSRQTLDRNQSTLAQSDVGGSKATIRKTTEAETTPRPAQSVDANDKMISRQASMLTLRQNSNLHTENATSRHNSNLTLQQGSKLSVNDTTHKDVGSVHASTQQLQPVMERVSSQVAG